MRKAPHVLVVARYEGADEAGQMARCLSKQTYRDTQLIFVQRTGKTNAEPLNSASRILSEIELPDYLEELDVAFVLFWPIGVELKEAAIEKLVLALQVAPDQDGVADAAQGSSGIWLARNRDEMIPLIELWLGSPLKWIEEFQRVKPGLFHIPENLTESPDPSALRQPYAVEQFFGKLPYKFENYRPISTGALWKLPTNEVDDRSVLFLVSSLPMGGACKFLLDITAQLKAQGYRVTVATTGYGESNPWLDELLSIVPDVFILSHSRPVELPGLMVHLARSRRCGRVVISHSMLGYQLLPWLRSELPDVSFLDYTHIEYETEWPEGGYALRSVNNQSMLDTSMVSSEHLRDWMTQRGPVTSGLHVVHTNIDADKWSPDPDLRARVRYELGIDTKTALILYPCRMAEQKRPELMCNIIAALRRATKSPFVVVAAGDGPLLPALKTFIERQGLYDSFRLLGEVSLDRVAQLHNAADILLLPSLIEGIALAVFEAMALASVPVVSDVGGQRELVTPGCGYTIPLSDARDEILAYATALKQLIENPDQCREMAVDCRKRVQEHFKLEQMTTRFIAALDAAGSRHNSRIIWLPEAAVCREMATLAVDQVRLTILGRLSNERGRLLEGRSKQQEKIILKLQKQLEVIRSEIRAPEANELLY